MQLKRYISQEQLPSRAPTSPVDFANFDRLGVASDRIGKAVSSVGESIYQADAPERAIRRQLDMQQLKAEEDLEVEEALTTYKSLAQEVIERHRNNYSPGASEEYGSIGEFSKNIVSELKDLVHLDSFGGMHPTANARFRTDAFKHVEELIPVLSKMRTDVLHEKSEARLGQAKATWEHKANLSLEPLDVIGSMNGYSADLEKAVGSKMLAPDKAVERSEKFNADVAEAWFNGMIGTDPDALFYAMQYPSEEQKYLFGYIKGKDRTTFTVDREKRVLDGIERKRKDDERNLELKQTAIENKFWDSFFNAPFGATRKMFEQNEVELRKLKPERYKSIAKEVSETRDAGGIGDAEKTNRWKTMLFHSSNALTEDEILAMDGLNWSQRQELYKAKRTQVEFEHSSANNPKHFSNDDNYKFYSKEIQDQLGVIKLSPFTNASQLQLLSQAEIAFRGEYERLHKENGGNVTQEEAKVLMQQIVKTTRQKLSFKAQTYGEVPRFTDPRDLEEARKAGKITEREYAAEWAKLKGWRELQRDEADSGSDKLNPKREFNKRGKE